MENIRYYPDSYTMSDELKRFFTKVTNDIDLQKSLNNTDTLAQVADIAISLGFNVRPAEILQAQAGRVIAIIKEQPDDVKFLLSGKKAKTGAQWGRGGNGYLDSPGYWLKELGTFQISDKIQSLISAFLRKAYENAELEARLNTTNSFNSLSSLMLDYGYDLKAKDLLMYQAKKILALDEDKADKMAIN